MFPSGNAYYRLRKGQPGDKLILADHLPLCSQIHSYLHPDLFITKHWVLHTIVPRLIFGKCQWSPWQNIGGWEEEKSQDIFPSRNLDEFLTVAPRFHLLPTSSALQCHRYHKRWCLISFSSTSFVTRCSY